MNSGFTNLISVILILLFQGCPLNGKCINENSTWTETSGEKCYVKTCSRVVNAARGYKFEVKTQYQGCSHNGKCHDVNSTWDIGCTTAKCNMVKQGKSFLLKLEPVGRKCQFKNKCYGVGKTAKDGCNEYFCNKFNDTDYRMDIKKGGCFINNKCHDVNATWKEGCITFQCKWEKTKFQHIFRKSVHSMGCPWKNKCFEPNEIETDQCISRRCISKVENNRYSAQMKETSAACFDKISGTCVALGEAVERDCVKFNCTRANPKSFPYLKSIGRGCKVNGVCMQKGTKWTDKEQCADFECKDHPKYGIPFPQRVRGGCKMNGVCKSVNESEENGCYKHICKEFKKNGQMYYGIEKRPNGCMEKDVCRPFGFVKETGCFKYVCSENNFKLLSAGCMGADKKCHEIGVSWVHKYPEHASCVYYKCNKNGSYYRNMPEKYGCLDSNGICRKEGEKGFDVKTPTFAMKNCHCKGDGQKVRVECQG